MEKLIIEGDGTLFFVRKGKKKKQECPRQCGTYCVISRCPLISEPLPKAGKYELELCESTHLFDELEDNR